MPRLQFHAYVDVERRLLTDAAGDPLGGDQLLQFFREEVGLLCLHCFNADGTPHAFALTDAFEFGLAADWDQTTAPQVLSENDQWNLPGDWVDVDPTAGLLSCRYNTNTANFNALFASNEAEANVGLYLKQVDPIGGNVTLCQYDAIARNIRRTDGTVPPGVEAPTYPTYAQVLMLLATTFQGPWAAGTAYTTGQTVSYAGGFFLARRGSIGSAPDPEASTADWAVMAAPGAPGAPGEDGDDGTDGRTIHTVTGAPASLTGVDGDYAIDPAATVLYGPKAAGAWPAGVSLRGADGSSDWTAWQNDDMDAGTEVLAEWTAPTSSAVWKVIGRISKGSAMIAFEALVAVCVVDDGYGWYTRTVKMTVQHTAEIGDCSVLSWAAAGVLYTDYDAGSGKVRLRVNLAAGAANWTAAGKWMRAA